MTRIWRSPCGGATLYRGDCRDVLPGLAAESIDAVITDPPYGVSFQHHCCRVKMGNGGGVSWRPKWPEILGDQNLDWSEPVWRELLRVMKCDSYAISFFGWPKAEQLLAVWRRLRLKMVSRVVWVKDRWMGLGMHTRGQHEQCMVMTKGRPRPQSRSFRDVRIWRTEHGLHASQKPVGLMADLVGQFSAPGDLVLDPFMGSASAGVAALRQGRRFVGIELDRDYFATAKRRVQEAMRGMQVSG